MSTSNKQIVHATKARISELHETVRKHESKADDARDEIARLESVVETLNGKTQTQQQPAKVQTQPESQATTQSHSKRVGKKGRTRRENKVHKYLLSNGESYTLKIKNDLGFETMDQVRHALIRLENKGKIVQTRTEPNRTGKGFDRKLYKAVETESVGA